LTVSAGIIKPLASTQNSTTTTNALAGVIFSLESNVASQSVTTALPTRAKPLASTISGTTVTVTVNERIGGVIALLNSQFTTQKTYAELDYYAPDYFVTEEINTEVTYSGALDAVSQTVTAVATSVTKPTASTVAAQTELLAQPTILRGFDTSVSTQTELSVNTEIAFDAEVDLTSTSEVEVTGVIVQGVGAVLVSRTEQTANADRTRSADTAVSTQTVTVFNTDNSLFLQGVVDIASQTTTTAQPTRVKQIDSDLVGTSITLTAAGKAGQFIVETRTESTLTVDADFVVRPTVALQAQTATTATATRIKSLSSSVTATATVIPNGTTFLTGTVDAEASTAVTADLTKLVGFTADIAADTELLATATFITPIDSIVASLGTMTVSGLRVKPLASAVNTTTNTDFTAFKQVQAQTSLVAFNYFTHLIGLNGCPMVTN